MFWFKFQLNLYELEIYAVSSISGTISGAGERETERGDREREVKSYVCVLERSFLCTQKTKYLPVDPHGSRGSWILSVQAHQKAVID